MGRVAGWWPGGEPVLIEDTERPAFCFHVDQAVAFSTRSSSVPLKIGEHRRRDQLINSLEGAVKDSDLNYQHHCGFRRDN